MAVIRKPHFPEILQPPLRSDAPTRAEVGDATHESIKATGRAGVVKSGEKAAGARPHGAAIVASALFIDRELLLADHLGPFLGLRLDVIGELLRCAAHRFEHLRRQEFSRKSGSARIF